MSFRKITCQEADELLGTGNDRYAGWWVASSLTDLCGEYGDPRISTTWQRGEVQVETVRHPPLYGEPGPDREPCEHFYYDGENLRQ